MSSETAAPLVCGADNVRVTTSGLISEYADLFTGRTSSLTRYLTASCKTLGSGSGFDVSVSWDRGQLTLLIVDPAFVPSPGAVMTGQREPFNGIVLQRQTALANALLGWSWGTVTGRPVTDPVRVAIDAAQYAVVYRRPERGQSMAFPFIVYDGRMHPQGTVLFVTGKETTVLTDTRPPEGLFALDPPDVPTLSGGVPSSAAVYTFFDVAAPG